MKATVKDIELYTHFEDDEWSDGFVESMRNMVGKTIEVEPFEDFSNWFTWTEDDGEHAFCWTFHRSWLEFVQ